MEEQEQEEDKETNNEEEGNENKIKNTNKIKQENQEREEIKWKSIKKIEKKRKKEEKENSEGIKFRTKILNFFFIFVFAINLKPSHFFFLVYVLILRFNWFSYFSLFFYTRILKHLQHSSPYN